MRFNIPAQFIIRNYYYVLCTLTIYLAFNKILYLKLSNNPLAICSAELCE